MSCKLSDFSYQEAREILYCVNRDMHLPIFQRNYNIYGTEEEIKKFCEKVFDIKDLLNETKIFTPIAGHVNLLYNQKINPTFHKLEKLQEHLKREHERRIKIPPLPGVTYEEDENGISRIAPSQK